MIDDGNDKPQVVVQYKGKETKYYPEEISAIMLSLMKKLAEDFN